MGIETWQHPLFSNPPPFPLPPLFFDPTPLSPYLMAPADGFAVQVPTGLHALVVGHESVCTLAQQPTPLDR